MRKQSEIAVALIGDGPVTVRCHDGDYLLVDCLGRDVWEFMAAYHALPLLVECGGVRYAKTAFRSDTQTAFYRVTQSCDTALSAWNSRRRLAG